MSNVGAKLRPTYIIEQASRMSKRLLREFVLVTVLLLLPVSVQANMFAKLAGLFDSKEVAAEEPVQPNDGALFVQLLSTSQNPTQPTAVGGGTVTTEGGALISTGPVGDEAIALAKQNSTGEISVYVVREGDSLSQIAEMYGVTANTILWANDLKSAASIKPGQTLVILPIAGVQHTVKSGDTIASLVKKYDADLDEVLAYNNLSEDSALKAGDELIIPGGTVQTVATVSGSGSSAAGTSAGWLSHPLPGSQKSQGIHGYNGIDFARVPQGSTVRAAAGGTVVVARSGGWNGGYGSYVVIKHGNGVQTLYAHLSSVEVSQGQAVAQGERIGGVGNTGRSTGIHLHFEVRGGKNPF